MNGSCLDCGAWSPQAVRIRAVLPDFGLGASLFACPDCVPRHIWRLRDLDQLARRRAAVTGETAERARAVLAGAGRAGGGAS